MRPRWITGIQNIFSYTQTSPATGDKPRRRSYPAAKFVETGPEMDAGLCTGQGDMDT